MTSHGVRMARCWRYRRLALLSAMAGGLLLAAPVSAQDDFDIEETEYGDPGKLERLTTRESWLEFGIYATGGDESFKFGDFTGLDRDSEYLLGNFDIWFGDNYDSPTARYLRLRGRNAGLESRAIDLDYRAQGAYRFQLFYDQTPKFQTDTGSTIFTNSGGSYLLLPEGFVRGSTVSALDLAGFVGSMKVQHERERYGASFSAELMPRLGFDLKVRREEKEGTKLVGFVVGNSGGNPRAIVGPEVIDYVTDQYEGILRYAGDRMQGNLGFYVSRFRNAEDAQIWENPYVGVAGWVGDTALAQKGLAPDNRFWQATGNLGFAITETTYLGANVAYGRMRQDERFLPYTVNPGVVLSSPLPRRNLDGRIDTLLAELRLTSRPLAKLRLEAGVRYDERDNETPHDIYSYVGGDSSAQEGIDGARARINHPFGFERTEYDASATYEILKRTYLKLGYEQERTKRTYLDQNELTEHIWLVSLRTRALRYFDASIEYSRGNRHGSGYDGARPFIEGHTEEYLATLASPDLAFENHPLLRRAYLNGRESDEWKLHLGFTPTEELSFGFDAGRRRDEYDRSVEQVAFMLAFPDPTLTTAAYETLGLHGSEYIHYTFDVSWQPTPALSLYGFFGREWIEQDQVGFNISAGDPRTHVLLPERRWYVDYDDDVKTFGLGARFTTWQERLVLGVDVVNSKANGRVKYALSPESYPDSESKYLDLSAHVTFRVNDRLSTRVGYLYERLQGADWIYDGVEVDNLGSNVLGTGQATPKYRSHIVALSMRYSF